MPQNSPPKPETSKRRPTRDLQLKLRLTEAPSGFRRQRPLAYTSGGVTLVFMRHRSVGLSPDPPKHYP